MSDKKKLQLGMNPSTASARLVKDLLWNFVETTGQDSCCKCRELMTRETFSIEHVVPWLDSADPVGLYFDIGNISFSHLICNIKASRPRPRSQPVCGTAVTYNDYNCRCDPCKLAKSLYIAKTYTKEARQERYKRTGN
tara:strand:- start:84 stop:497 length:414 start_codon:yes stop_codon:yes gene_type:complete